MTDTDQRAFAETIFERNQRRDVEINEAPSRTCTG